MTPEASSWCHLGSLLREEGLPGQSRVSTAGRAQPPVFAVLSMRCSQKIHREKPVLGEVSVPQTCLRVG